MNKLIKAQLWQHGFAIRIPKTASLFLLLFCILPFTLNSQAVDGLVTGNQASTFKDVLISSPTATIKQYLHMEALWEMDMSKASAGDAANDADQNNHNLFVIDGIAYAYVEKYNVSGETVTLRRFDISTGEPLDDIRTDFSGNLSNASLQRYVMADQAGHIAIIGLSQNANTKGIKLYIQIYDKDLVFIKEISYVSEESDISDRFLANCEWLGLTGDLMSGNFSLVIGCWHCWGNTSSSETQYFPSRCEFIFTQPTNVPEINITRYENGEYEFETRSGSSSGSVCKGMFFVEEVDRDHHIVQGFGSTASPDTHSPVLLYESKGKQHNISARTPYTMLSQVDMLSKPEFKYVDSGCFGAFPVNVGEERLLVMPYQRNADDGVTFKIARWKDMTSFSFLESMWQMPDNKYPCGKKYNTLRPKVVSFAQQSSGHNAVSQSKNEAENLSHNPTILLSYMPGSFLGAYKVSIVDDPVASGMILFNDDSARNFRYSLEGRTLRIYGVDKRCELDIYKVDATKVCSTEINGRDMEKIVNLDNLEAGVYILNINGKSHKLILR